MDRRKIKIDNFIFEFVENVKNSFNIEKIIFFGSRAKGEGKKESDFDFIIVSNDFKGIKSFKRSPKIYLTWKYPYSVDIICLTPEEFNQKKKEIGVIRDAVSYGVEM